jgi:hypothetical protein
MSFNQDKGTLPSSTTSHFSSESDLSSHFREPDKKRQKMDSENPLVELADFQPKLQHCFVTSVLAFPTSLAVFRGGAFHWNATCWLDQFYIEPDMLNKITFHPNHGTFPRESMLLTDKIVEITPSTINRTKRLKRLLVFLPHMTKGFHSTKESINIQRIWIDEIFLPWLYRNSDSRMCQYYPRSYGSLPLNAGVERIEVMRDVGDMPESVRPASLEAL